MTTRQEGSFTAVDGDGNEHTVNIFRGMIASTHLSSRVRTQMPARLRELRTSDGRAVNRIDKGSYEIVDHPMIPITSDDPNAP